jgi:hypothetical protein
LYLFSSSTNKTKVMIPCPKCVLVNDFFFEKFCFVRHEISWRVKTRSRQHFCNAV